MPQSAARTRGGIYWQIRYLGPDLLREQTRVDAVERRDALTGKPLRKGSARVPVRVMMRIVGDDEGGNVYTIRPAEE